MSGFTSTTTMMVLGAALLAVAVPAPENVKVHEQMTPEEIRQVFQTEPNAIPVYEEISIMLPKQHKRAAGTPTHIQLNAFGRNISLWLNPVDGILAGYDTPVYYAQADQKEAHGVRFNKIQDPMTVAGRILEDKRRKTTLVVKRAANGKKLVSGTIGSENLTIRPLPNRFNYQNFGRRQRFADDYGVENATITENFEHNRHVIYKTHAATKGTKYASQSINTDFLDSESSRSKRGVNIPSIVYPQILVVADYATYQRHNGDSNALLEYLLPFWNAVDLRYRGLENPKIRLNIAGVIIEAGPNTLSYIRQNKVKADRLDVYTALKESGDFRRKIESIFPLNSTDIMVTMTPYDMCNGSKLNCPIGLTGLAYVGGACKSTHSVTILRDKGGFDGVHSAAHELGHLFGAVHDEGPETNCSIQAGHIMTASLHLSNYSGDWSPCSLNEFDKFFRQRVPDCLFNEPQSRSLITRVLPGRFQTMDDQCMKIRGTMSCHRNPFFPPDILAKFAREVCLKLRCLSQTGESCSTMKNTPADGSICGEGMICLHAKCIREADITF